MKIGTDGDWLTSDGESLDALKRFIQPSDHWASTSAVIAWALWLFFFAGLWLGTAVATMETAEFRWYLIIWLLGVSTAFAFRSRRKRQ